MPFIALPAGTLHVREAGNGPRVLLLIHGNCASSRWWNNLLCSPPEGLRLLAPDLRGCGESMRPGSGYDVATLATDLHAVLDACGVECCDIVGHSLGGAVALQMALDAPQRCRSLLLATPAPADGMPLQAPFSWLGAERTAQLFPNIALNRTVLTRALPRVAPGLHDPAALAELLDDALACEHAAVAGFTASLMAFNVIELLHSLTCPTLLLAGALDPLVPPLQLQATTTALPHSHLLIWPDCGHAPQLEHSQRFISLLTRWLADPAAVLNEAPLEWPFVEPTDPGLLKRLRQWVGLD